MSSGMLDAIKGCLKEEIRLDTVSNNIANSTVVGFKKERLSFKNILDQLSAGSRGGSSVLGTRVTDLVTSKTDFSQGDTRHTGNSLDFAIIGHGFFKIDTPQGIRYTRKGDFTLNGEGMLSTQDGYKVLGAGGPITISGNNIQVDGRGSIKVDGSEVGQINAVSFEDYGSLIKEGNSLFRNDSDQPEKVQEQGTRINQEYLEISNVNIAEEMIQMISSLRAFESYKKSIQILDQINNKVINEVGRTR